MNLRPEFPFLPAAVLVLGPAIPARSQNPADGARPICRSSTVRRNGFGPDKCWVPQPITVQSGSIATMPPNGMYAATGFIVRARFHQQLG
jgi:hypothetical protein